VSFRILGMSLAAINTIFSLILSVMFIRLFINYEKN
ncbi:MAG TPA: disulfide bond formation protein B, partial [Pelagibacteraceae bacterium]|nr:disulfide bond formation protein B [Pelagibacteraceae bacterium]